MIRGLNSMDRAQCVATMGDLQGEIRQLTESKHRLSLNDEASLSALQDDYDELAERVRRLDTANRFADSRRDGDRSVAFEGEDGMRRGDGMLLREYVSSGRDDSYRIPGRDRAMGVLERSVRDELVAAAGAEAIERQLAEGPLMAREWTARWVAATGSDTYRSAFAKKALDPDSGHLSWTAQEAEAWRVATTVQHERAAMSLTDSSGGYLVPFQLDPTVLLTSGGSANPLMQIARVEPTVTDVWRGVTSAGVTAEWLGEGAEAADASPTLGSPSVPCHKAGAFVPWSYEVGMDASNFLEELAKLLLDGLDQLTSLAFTLGSGTGQPTGVVAAVAAAGGASVVAPTTAETFAAADLYRVQNAAAPRWQVGSSWLMNLAFVNTARQFETASGALRFPELRDNPPMLLGRSVYENSHMDAAINPAATESNYVALYGDFKQFIITVRSGSTLELIPNLMGDNGRPTGQRGGFLWARYGSDVLVPNAFRLLSIPTTA